MTDCRAPIILAFFAVAGLAGCARHTIAIASPTALPAVVPPRPVLAQGYGAVIPPPRGADGRYRTINTDITAQQAVWHLRAALNVAAIGCRGPADSGLTPAYNMLLASKKTVLADANRAMQARFRARSAATWQSDSDAYMTRLYNFFAMPAAKVAFCAAADAVAPQAAAAPATGFTDFATTALPQLEAPFTDVYAAIDQYKVELAAWDTRYGPGATRLASAAPAVAPRTDPMRAGPVLAYADLAPMMAWEPHRNQALAFR